MATEGIPASEKMNFNPDIELENREILNTSFDVKWVFFMEMNLQLNIKIPG